MSLALPTARIGDTTVTAIGYGAMGIGGTAYGAAGSDEERFRVLDRLYELGERNIDTANVYGDSEEVIGKWLKRTGHRDMFIATKFGYVKPDFSIRGDPEFVLSEFERSFAKLGQIDLYYLHRADPKTPIEITVGAMAELVKEGKIKHIGLSECSPDTIRRAHKVHPIAAVQIEYSPFELFAEAPGGIIETCKELGIAIVAYSPTGRGLLSGRFRSPDDFEATDFRKRINKFSKENFPTILKLVDGLKDIGAAHGATAAQVAIAWTLAQGTIPLPGSKQIPYIEENLGAAKVQLTLEDLVNLRGLVDETDKATPGDRYPPGLMHQLLADTPPLDA